MESKIEVEVSLLRAIRSVIKDSLKVAAMCGEVPELCFEMEGLLSEIDELFVNR